MTRLADRVAVVTGAGTGIGLAIARRFAREGAAVVIADIDAELGDRACETIRADGGTASNAPTDVTRHGDVELMIRAAEARHGRVDVLVNNAAGDPPDGVFELDRSAWDDDLALTLTAPFLCARAVLPGMIARGGGCILNITSVNAHAALGNEAYSAAKAGLMNLTQSIAVRYGPHGIRANAIAPGTIQTGAPNWRHRLAKDPEVFERVLRWYPLGRVGTPDDIAKAALFLASDDAAWVTGTVLRVDGGLLAGNAVMARDLAGDGGETTQGAEP